MIVCVMCTLNDLSEAGGMCNRCVGRQLKDQKKDIFNDLEKVLIYPNPIKDMKMDEGNILWRHDFDRIKKKWGVD